MQVSTYCLGAMMYGAMGNTDHEDCVKAINIALDAGVNFIDTADVYSRGESEEIVARHFAPVAMKSCWRQRSRRYGRFDSGAG